MGTNNGEKEYAVIKFYADEKYATCSQRNKANDSAGYFIGEEVTIQWSKHEVYKGIVVYTDGKIENIFHFYVDCNYQLCKVNHIQYCFYFVCFKIQKACN
jgi:hypothetical protein